MGFKPGNQHGKRFSSTYQPKKNGRKPALFNLLTVLVDKEAKIELSKEDFIRLQLWLIEQPKGDLITILKHPETPVFISVIISAILTDIKNGKNTTIENILGRSFGKSNKINLQVEPEPEPERTTNDIDLKALSDDELKTLGKIIKQSD